MVSGQPVTRPSGQIKQPGEDRPAFALGRMLDYEMEVGIFIGPGNALGDPIPMEEAGAHIFGFCNPHKINNEAQWISRSKSTWHPRR
jgi:fumarylacetoacetase